jgi:hypothetical protein
MAKESEYVKSMSEARAKDPKNYDKKKEMYDAATKKEAEDKDYSPMDALKNMGKKIIGKKKGGKVKSYAKGGGCEIKGKTKGRFV